MACCQMLISTCASACLPRLELTGLPTAAGAVLAVLTLGAIGALQACYRMVMSFRVPMRVWRAVTGLLDSCGAELA